MYRLVLSRHCAPPLFADKVGGKGKANNLVETKVFRLHQAFCARKSFLG